ncbi:MAG: hypothetical protein U0U67_06875 [Chitinophagales bacterium]
MISAKNISFNLSEFLTNKKWKKVGEFNRSFKYEPPIDLGFEKNYFLYIPKNINSKDYIDSAEKTTEILSEIYKEDVDDLHSILIESKEIFTFRYHDESALEGKPSFPRFNKINDRIEKMLKDVASFTVKKETQILDSSIEEAERYLYHCRFIKNLAGSVITKIELPNEEFIKEKNIFEESIKGHDVNSKLLSVLSFVNSNLLNNNPNSLEESFLKENRENININLIDDIREFYNETKLSDIDFTLKRSKKNLTSSVSGLNKENIRSLQSFTKTIKEKINNRFEDEFYGKVVELKSKDVESENNSIKVLALIKNVEKVVSVSLNSEEYKLAIDAHAENKNVVLKGIVEKEKTQYKIIELQDFSIKKITN